MTVPASPAGGDDDGSDTLFEHLSRSLDTTPRRGTREPIGLDPGPEDNDGVSGERGHNRTVPEWLWSSSLVDVGIC